PSTKTTAREAPTAATPPQAKQEEPSSPDTQEASVAPTETPAVEPEPGPPPLVEKKEETEPYQAPPTLPVPTPEIKPIVWESFERPHWWTVEAADGPAKLRVVPDHATDGKAALKVYIIPSHRAKAQIRREVRLDLSEMSKFMLDVFAAIDGASVALGLYTAGGAAYYESKPVSLLRGDNRDVTFDLDVPNFKTGGGYDQLIKAREDVRRVCLIFREQGNRGAVFLDNLRFVGMPHEGWEKREPRILSVTANAPVVHKYDRIELDVKFDATYADYFNPGEINIRATFLAPNGDRFTAYGFLADFVTGPDGVEQPQWLIRFAPTRVGRWEYTVWVRNKFGEARSTAQYFDCREAASNPGFIRRSRSDPRYFEFDSGEPFYPLGQNVCWAGNYEDYFAKMSANGEN
ncbi:MAG TPA: DUF5060 domain-containing protein, partial [Planctomycetaceae bacterium]|nr:DUF5060 domain-containing protein [Planctomycetaceae bacterium]